MRQQRRSPWWPLRVRGQALREPVLERGQQQQVLEQEQGQGQGQQQVLEQVPGPTHHHNLWLRWRGSKPSFSSTRQMSFSKLHRRRCANC